MTNKKKNKKKVASKPTPQTMSPKQYFQSGRPRTLPLYECLINSDWKESGMAVILVARQHVTGSITFSSYIVDIFCLGVKDTNSSFNRLVDDYEFYKGKIYSMFDELPMPISYDLAHNIIFGAIEYAKKLGFSPHRDWGDSQFMLQPKDSSLVEKMDIDFGKDGKPFYISGPHDKVDTILQKLEKAVGKGNYHFLAGGGLNHTDFDYLDGHEDVDMFDDDDDDDDDVEDIDYEEVKK
jgi:hypothetical protein